MISKELLNSLSSNLGVKSRIVEADIRDLAWCWQLAVEASKVTSPEFIHQILISVSRAYLRGRERRIGNFQGLLKHWVTIVTVPVLIIQHVVEEPILYESLHKAGVTSEEAYLAIKNQAMRRTLGLEQNILEEAETILESKQHDSGKGC